MNEAPPFAEAVYDRTPPFSLEAETAVLGGMFISRDAVSMVGEHINEAVFYREANRRLYRTMVRLYERGDAIDAITVADELKKTGEMDAAGGYDYIAQLVDAVPSASNIEYHARIVADKAMLRKLVEQASQTIRDVYDQGERTTAEIIAEAEQRVLAIDIASNKAATRVIKDLLWEAFAKIEEWQKLEEGETAGLSTGFSSLDKRTTGMHPGEFWVVAGRPSMGKTALALDILKNVTIGGGKVWIKSLEMESTELTVRMLAGEARLDLLKLRSGENMSQDENQRLAAAAGHLNSAGILIDDNPLATIGEIRSTGRRIHREHDLSLIIVDYLQLIEGGGNNRQEDVSQISRGLKLMSRELKVPVMGVSQLSRGVENRTNKRPILSDLRESGSIEQDADIVMMVYRPEYYMSPAEISKSAEKPKTDARGLAEIVIPKQRNGPTGTVALFFDKPTTRFSEWKDRVLW